MSTGGILHGALLALAALGLVAIPVAVFSFLRFRLWVRECRRQRVLVAEKGKVKLQAPLSDFLTWGRMLKADEASGRVIFHMRGISIAIARPDVDPTPKVEVRKVRRRPWRREGSPA